MMYVAAEPTTNLNFFKVAFCLSLLYLVSNFIISHLLNTAYFVQAREKGMSLNFFRRLRIVPRKRWATGSF